MRRLLVLAVLSVALTSVIASVAGAQAPTSLGWTRAPGAESCIDAAALAEAVAARLGREAFVEDGATLRIEGTVIPQAPGFEVRLVLRAGDEVVGERLLTSRRRRCSALDDSLVLMVALLVEVGEQSIEVALPELTEPPVDPPPAAPATTTPEPAPTEPEAASADPLSWLRPSFALGARGSIDALPGPAIGIHGAVELGAPVAVRIAGGYLPEVGVSGGDDRTARLSLAWGQLGVCADASPSSSLSWLTLGACGSVSAGAVLGSGIGFDVSRSGLLPWLALELAARMRLAVLGPLGVELAGGFEVPLLTGRFVVGQGGAQRVVYAVPPIAPFLSLSLILRIE